MGRVGLSYPKRRTQQYSMCQWSGKYSLPYCAFMSHILFACHTFHTNKIKSSSRILCFRLWKYTVTNKSKMCMFMHSSLQRSHQSSDISDSKSVAIIFPFEDFPVPRIPARISWVTSENIKSSRTSGPQTFISPTFETSLKTNMFGIHWLAQAMNIHKYIQIQS